MLRALATCQSRMISIPNPERKPEQEPEHKAERIPLAERKNGLCYPPAEQERVQEPEQEAVNLLTLVLSLYKKNPL